MGLSGSIDIFQEKMSEMFQDLENVQACADDLLVISTGSHEDCPLKLNESLERLGHAGPKANAKKLHFCQEQAECLGHLISHKGIQPSPSEIKAIVDIAIPQTGKQLR